MLVIPKIAEEGEGEAEYDSYIVLFNNKSGQVISKYIQPGAWISDAVKLVQIDIDTAPYKIKPGKRAFGIRVLYSGSSRVFPYSAEFLSLYVPDGDTLVKVWDDFEVSSFTGEWGMDCRGRYTTEKKVLVVSGNSTNGYYDLIIKNTITNITERAKGEDCDEETEEKRASQTLRFRDGKYQ